MVIKNFLCMIFPIFIYSSYENKRLINRRKIIEKLVIEYKLFDKGIIKNKEIDKIKIVIIEIINILLLKNIFKNNLLKIISINFF